jgi:hypothetical protein
MNLSCTPIATIYLYGQDVKRSRPESATQSISTNISFPLAQASDECEASDSECSILTFRVTPPSDVERNGHAEVGVVI